MPQKKPFSSWWMWLPIPLSAAIMAVSWGAHLNTAYESQALLMAFNFLFSTLASALIVVLVGLSYCAGGTPSLLLLGCGVLFWGCAGTLVAPLLARGINVAVTVHNFLIWLAALCHLTGVMLNLKPFRKPRRPALVLAFAYIGAACAVGLVVGLAWTGRMPVFFIQGTGGTPFRTLILGSSIAMFVATWALLWRTSRPLPSAFVRWYGAALLLVAIGLLGIMVETVHGGVLSWTGRAAQFLGGAYMLAAAIASVRESGRTGIRLDANQWAEWHEAWDRQVLRWLMPRRLQTQSVFWRYGIALVLVAGTVALRRTLIPWMGVMVPYNLTVPAIMATAMFLGAGPGLVSVPLMIAGVELFVLAPGTMDAERSVRIIVVAAVGIFICMVLSSLRYALRKLQASEEAKFSALFHGTSEGILLVDPGTRKFRLGNEAMCRMLGYTAEELKRRQVEDIHPPEAFADAMAALEKHSRGEIDEETILPMRRKDGSVFYASVSATPISIGGTTYLTGFFRDITKRQLSEAALRESHSLMAAAMESTADGILVVNNNGQVSSFNKRFLELWRIPPPLADTRDDAQWLRFVLDQLQDPETFRSKVQQLYHDKEASSWDELVFKDGRIFERYSQPQRRGNAIVGRVWSFRDVTERRQAEGQTRDSERRFRDLFENSPDAIFIEDETGRVLDMNPAACQLQGISREDMVGRNVLDLVPAEERAVVKHEFPKWLTGELTQYKGFTYSARGEKIPVEIRGAPITYGDRKAVLLHVRDITREVEMEQQIRQAQKMEAVGQLAGGVAHDFNNILQAIFGFCEILLAGLPENSAHRQDVLEIQKSGNRAASLTRQLLAFSRRQIITPTVLDLNGIVLGTEKMLKRLIGEDVLFDARLAPDLRRVKADAGSMEQVLLNLVINARDAMPQGGLITITTANVRLDEEAARTIMDARSGDFVCLAVADTGCGMAPETVQHIFEPFFSTKGPDKGTGLGLAVIYGIVRQHEGWVNVYSEENRGTAFKVYLPAYRDESGALEAGPAKESGVLRSRSRERILLLEDDSTIRHLLERILSNAGYEIFFAETIAAARELFIRENGHFDLFFTDIVLPDGSGFDAAEEFLARNSEISVLFSSGYTDERARWGDIESRGLHFIQKPYVTADLLRIIRHILDGRRNR